MSSEQICLERPADVIPGVYKYCDDWCARCPVPNRCLSYRMRQKQPKRFRADRIMDLSDMVAFTREIAVEAGESTPALDAMLAGDPNHEYQPEPDDEWLVQTGHQYAAGAGFLLQRAGWSPPRTDGMGVSPSPLDVIAWYHFFLSIRADRALVSMGRAERGHPEDLRDALGCAKIALISADRSAVALRKARTHLDPRIPRTLLSLLEKLTAGLEARVPGARAFIRVGLDAPAA